jgi:hypothetical protein
LKLLRGKHWKPVVPEFYIYHPLSIRLLSCA